jgi:alpha-tubulin suppressor-like RCC1 family protein
VAGGHGHTLAVKSDGSLWAWGRNGSGQLGLGDHVNRSTPVRVGAAHGWVAVVGGHDSLALKKDGSLWAWGWNKYGQLGLGDHTQRDVPTLVTGGPR